MKVLIKCFIGVMFHIGMLFTLGILCEFPRYWSHSVLNNGFIMSTLLTLFMLALGYAIYELLKREVFDKI